MIPYFPLLLLRLPLLQVPLSLLLLQLPLLLVQQSLLLLNLSVLIQLLLQLLLMLPLVLLMLLLMVLQMLKLLLNLVLQCCNVLVLLSHHPVALLLQGNILLTVALLQLIPLQEIIVLVLQARVELFLSLKLLFQL